MTEEHRIQNEIRMELAPYCVLFRVNVGAAYTKDGRYLSTGVPAGFSDLFGFRFSDGRAVFIEVKAAKGRVSAKQRNFINKMREYGAIAGVCRDVTDARILIKASLS